MQTPLTDAELDQVRADPALYGPQISPQRWLATLDARHDAQTERATRLAYDAEYQLTNLAQTW